jgi:hypothetical protein
MTWSSDPNEFIDKEFKMKYILRKSSTSFLA